MRLCRIAEFARKVRAGTIESLFQGLFRRGIEKMKCGVPQRDRGPWIVDEDEYRCAERRFVAPPALPVEILPRPALRAELVAPQDPAPTLLR